MKQMLVRTGLARSASLLAVMLVLAGPVTPLAAQDNVAEARIRSMEAQIRAMQRKVFPGDGKVFGPEIVSPAGPAAAPQPASTTPVGDLATRLDSVEAQLRRLTGLAEENSNKLAQLEARVNGTGSAPAAAATPAAVASATPAPTPTPAPSPSPTATPSTPDTNLAAMTSGASAPASCGYPRRNA